MISNSNSLIIFSVFFIILNFLHGWRAVATATVATAPTTQPVGGSTTPSISTSTTTSTSTTATTSSTAIGSIAACSVHSAQDSDDFWVSAGRCTACTETIGCGFCQSTLQCVPGDATGPLSTSSSSSGSVSCPSWSFQADTCPVLPHCELYSDCVSCAASDQCAWCASSRTCATLSEAFSSDCQGLVFEPPCPSELDAGGDNIVVGNLVVRADPVYGGGGLNVLAKSSDLCGTASKKSENYTTMRFHLPVL